MSCLGLGRSITVRSLWGPSGSDSNLLSFLTGTWVTFGGQVTDQVGASVLVSEQFWRTLVLDHLDLNV